MAKNKLKETVEKLYAQIQEITKSQFNEINVIKEDDEDGFNYNIFVLDRYDPDDYTHKINVNEHDELPVFTEIYVHDVLVYSKVNAVNVSDLVEMGITSPIDQKYLLKYGNHSNLKVTLR